MKCESKVVLELTKAKSFKSTIVLVYNGSLLVVWQRKNNIIS